MGFSCFLSPRALARKEGKVMQGEGPLPSIECLLAMKECQLSHAVWVRSSGAEGNPTNDCSFLNDPPAPT